MVRVADFDRFVFVVGAPRCGTTTLSHFLKASPSVSSPVVKEPHFFALNDLRSLEDNELAERVESEYLRRFFGPGGDHRIGLDASVTYLYTPEQLEPILRLWPQSRFVVSLRSPLTMLPSLHRRLIYIGDETIERFDDAWAATADRRAGRRIPDRCADQRWLLYDEAARFATYVERLFAAVGRERCLVLLFDDLVADPAAQYSRLIDFAGVEPTPGIDLKPRRASYGVRSLWLQRMLKRPPQAVRHLLASDKLWQRMRDLDSTEEQRPPGILAVRKRLLAWNRVPANVEPLSPELRAAISRQYAGEVDRLGALLGRDLSHWLEPAEKASPGKKAKRATLGARRGRRTASAI